jgi:hypothetical protein
LAGDEPGWFVDPQFISLSLVTASFIAISIYGAGNPFSIPSQYRTSWVHWLFIRLSELTVSVKTF